MSRSAARTARLTVVVRDGGPAGAERAALALAGVAAAAGLSGTRVLAGPDGPVVVADGEIECVEDLAVGVARALPRSRVHVGAARPRNRGGRGRARGGS